MQPYIVRVQMISIITICNNKEILGEYLLKSLNEQTTDYELIVIDNKDNNTFSHATKALNYGGSLAKGDYLMFIHQDVALWGNNFLEKFEKMLTGIEDIGIGGVAGMTQGGQPYLFLKNCGALSGLTSPFQRPVKVQTLDELLLVMPKHVFKTIHFDDNLPGWHCYGADYCLEVEKYGLSAYALPFFVHHRSAGFSSVGLMGSLKYLKDKWGIRISHLAWNINEEGDIIKGGTHLKFTIKPLDYTLIRGLFDYILNPIISRKSSLFYFPINHSEDSTLPLIFTIEKLNVDDHREYPITVVVANPNEVSNLIKGKFNFAYVIPPNQGVDMDKATSAMRLITKRVIVRKRHANLIWIYFWRLFS